MKFIPWAHFFKRRNQIVDEKAAVIAIEAPKHSIACHKGLVI